MLDSVMLLARYGSQAFMSCAAATVHSFLPASSKTRRSKMVFAAAHEHGIVHPLGKTLGDDGGRGSMRRLVGNGTNGHRLFFID